MMLIRYGYEITLTCAQPTALVCLLSVHEDRTSDIRAPETIFTMPEVPTTAYHDLFGNRCRRLVAPAGDLTLWGDATIEDEGKPDAIAPSARELAVVDLPDECLVYLMGSGYCETDRLSRTAWDMFGNIAPGWGRVQAICDFVHATSASITCRPVRRGQPSKPSTNGSACAATSRIWRSRFAAVSTSRHATSTAISAISACRWSTQWISVPGSRFFWTADGTRSIRVTTFRASAALWWHGAAMRQTFRLSTHLGRIC
jgi:hypothetical protein